MGPAVSPPEGAGESRRGTESELESIPETEGQAYSPTLQMNTVTPKGEGRRVSRTNSPIIQMRTLRSGPGVPPNTMAEGPKS